MENKTLALGVLALALMVLVWSPWLDGQEIRGKVLEEKGKIDGSVDTNGRIVCAAIIP